MTLRYTPLLTVLAMFFFISMSHSPKLPAENKPLLSEEIRSVIENEGLAAAKTRFAELYPSQTDKYDADTVGLSNLGSGYMQSGDMEKGMAVLEMVSAMAQVMASSMSSQAAEANPMAADFLKRQQAAREEHEKEQQVARAEEQKVEQKIADQHSGKSRDELGRFTGIYGIPGGSDSHRTIWVMESCDGFLVSGASWGGGGQWWMRSAADRVFTYQDSFQSFSMEFESSPNGNEQSMIHDLDAISSPLERMGPVPDDWGRCLERPKR